jgi:hypothetical protein
MMLLRTKVMNPQNHYNNHQSSVPVSKDHPTLSITFNIMKIALDPTSFNSTSNVKAFLVLEQPL